MKTFKEIGPILDFIKPKKNFLITAHARPDGDALGSEIAFGMFLKKMDKNVRIVHLSDIPKEYSFLPGRNMVEEINAPIKGNYDAIIILDSDGFDRLEKLAGYLPSDLPILNIDHHPSNNQFGAVNWSDENMSSVGEMVYYIIRSSPVKLDKNMAVNLYVSLITDTGYFRFDSTTPSAHVMASELIESGISLTEIYRNIYQNQTESDLALRCETIQRIKVVAQGKIAYTELTRGMYRRFKTEPTDSQQYLDILKSIKGVLLSFLFRETKNKSDGIKISIRSVNPLNAHELARIFGGGGHYRAAGCTIYKPLKQAQKMLVAEAIKFISKYQ
jgi:phosphoesterase RecJ-like protein